MKILAINGSSRKNGNTTIILNTVLDKLKKVGIETELIELAGQTINLCKACFTCGGKNNCSFDNDMFVVGSTYWNMVYGQMIGDVLKDEEGMANMKTWEKI